MKNMKTIFIIFVQLLIYLFSTSDATEELNILNSFSQLAGDFAELFGEEECVFSCENGEKPVMNPKHIPSSNGCGSFGIKIDMESLPHLTKCCDKHDICYDTCGTVKETCDKEFKKCLNKTCKKLYSSNIIDAETFKGCKATASMFYGGTSALGCPAFKDSQEKACLCSSNKSQKRKQRKAEL